MKNGTKKWKRIGNILETTNPNNVEIAGAMY